MSCKSLKMVKRIIASILTFLMVLGAFNIPFAGKSGVKAGSYLYEMWSDQRSYNFDYQDAMYDEGEAVLLMVTVSPKLDMDQYQVAFGSVGGNMIYNIVETRDSADGNSTELVFRGNYQLIGGVDNGNSGSLNVAIYDKDADLTKPEDVTVYGKISIPITYYDSNIMYDVTWDGNGGYATSVKKDSSEEMEDKTTYVTKVKNNGKVSNEGINPKYVDSTGIFVGWKIDGDESETIYYQKFMPGRPWVNNIEVTGNITLKAVWEECVTVKFVTTLGEITEASTQTNTKISSDKQSALFSVPVGTQVSCSVYADSEGLGFAGWRCSDDNELYSNSDIYTYVANSDVTFTAEWTDDVYKIIFSSSEGYLPGENPTKVVRTVVSGQKFGLGGPKFGAPKPTGHPDKDFICWVDMDTQQDVDYNTFYNFTPERDYTFIAKWKNKHNYDTFEVIRKATCTEKGEILWHCSDPGCTATKTEVVPEEGHEVVIDKGYDSTTTKTGLTEGSHCSKCKAVLKRQEVIPKKTETSSGKIDNGTGNNGTGNNGTGNNGTGNNGTGNNGTGNNGTGNNDAGKDSGSSVKYSNEWVDGKWYDGNGICSYDGILSWKSNATGWWAEDSKGWYPAAEWQKIDGKWYYFDATGYMAANEWYDGCWLSASGAWEYEGIGAWRSDATGWWFEDTSGWWAAECWQKIDGKWYYFGSDGYMVTSQYIDGYWIDENGVCQ